MIIGILFWIAILIWISYKLYLFFAPSQRLKRKEKKIEAQILKEKLSLEEATCYACGAISTKDKMKQYNIVLKEIDLGTHTENILGGLGGSKQVRTKRVYYRPEYICKSCEMNWEIACVLWIIVMLAGETITYLIYHFMFSPNTDTAVNCFLIGTVLSLIIARYCWRRYRIHKHCHIKVLNK